MEKFGSGVNIPDPQHWTFYGVDSLHGGLLRPGFPTLTHEFFGLDEVSQIEMRFVVQSKRDMTFPYADSMFMEWRLYPYTSVSKFGFPGDESMRIRILVIVCR
jgi:hypothetical protein